MLPNFGPRSDVAYPNGYLIIPIAGDGLRKLGEKLARGITYLRTACVIGPGYEIATDIVEDHHASAALAPFRGGS